MEQEIRLIILLAVLILLSSFFSATETAFSSVSKVKLKNKTQNGSKAAKRTLYLAERFDKVLIVILIGNNIVNIAAASIATVIFVRYWGDFGVTLATIVMTTLVLIFGEITPKSIAKEIPEKFALTVTPIVYLLIWILAPFSFIFGLWQKFMNRVLKFEKEAMVTEEELLTYVDEAKLEGEINENEQKMIQSVIDFDDLKIEDIFTPRVDVVAIDMNDDNKKITHIFKTSGFSRLPVYEKDIDKIVGIINHKDFYNVVLLEKRPLTEIIKAAVNVTEYMKASDLLSLLKMNQSHMAIVKDEFGGTLGIVTLEDVLEELVGEIWDEHDEIIEEITKLSDHAYQVKGQADLEQFFEIINFDEEIEHQTVNGWVLEQLGKIPSIGDQFSYKNLHVSIMNADEKRVLEVVIKLDTIIEEHKE
jgi:putative hemolysin